MNLKDATTHELLEEIRRRRKDRTLLIAADICRLYGVSKQRINQFKKNGRLPFEVSDNNLYIEADKAQEFFDELSKRRRNAK